jgi:predicted 3-demethylubiquinone-9 3-methyltransferase (glyoxalase superfamily)
MQKIVPFLWFDNSAEEAMSYYASVFKDSKIVNITRLPGDSPSGPRGTVIVGTFQLCGIQFMALNGGPAFKFNESVSFLVQCETQEEVDYFWDKLVAGGKASQCGWLKDKFGLSWQIFPTILGKLLGDPDTGKAQRAMQAMLKMEKLNIAALQAAFDGR